MKKRSSLIIKNIKSSCYLFIFITIFILFAVLPAQAQLATKEPPSSTDNQSQTDSNSQQKATPLFTLKNVVVEGQLETEQAKGEVGGIIAKQGYSATKTDTPLIKTPQSISVVLRDQIEMQGATSVAEALNYTSGVGPIFGGTTNRHNALYLRGLGDGQIMYLDGLAIHGGRKLNSWLLERIEVIKGPSSVLYGQGNPGGLINMVSKRPTAEPIRTLRFAGGIHGKAEAAFDIGGALPNNSNILYRLNGIATQVDDFTEHNKEQTFAIAPSVTFYLGSQTELTILTSYQNEPKMGSQTYYPAFGTLYATPFGRMPYRFDIGEPGFDKSKRHHTMLGYEFEHRFNEVFTFRQNARFSTSRHDEILLIFDTYDPTGENPTLMYRVPISNSEKMHEGLLDNQLNAIFTTGSMKHNVLMGVDYKRSSLKQKNWDGELGYPIDWRNPIYGAVVDRNSFELTGDQRQKIIQKGIYLQDHMELDRWNLLLSGRYDWIKSSTTDHLENENRAVNDRAFSGRAALLYEFESGFSPYVSYSTSFNASNGIGADAKPFKPTKGKETEIGLKYQPVGYNMMMSAAIFDLNQTNVTTYNSATHYYEQMGKIRSRGFELEGHATINENIDLIVEYSYTDVKNKRTLNQAELNKVPTIIPKHTASLWGNYHFIGGPLNHLTVGAGIRYVGSTFGDRINSFKVPSYTNYDLMMRYDIEPKSDNYGGASIQFNVRNLTNKKFVSACRGDDSCFLGAGRSANLSLVIDF